MNFLKYSFLGGVLVTSCITYAMYETLTYKQGNENDLLQLLELYKTIEKNKDDKNKLVVLSEEIRKMAILSSLQQGQFYVAKNKEDTIIGFKKLYKINKDNLSGILQDELNFIDSHLLLNTCYMLPGTKNDLDDMLKLKLTDYNNDERLENPEDFYTGKTSCSYIYTGGSYTDSKYRQNGINSNITQYALNKVLEGENLSKLPSSYALVYGQVESNITQVNMIKTFAYCMTTLYNKNNTPQNTIKLFHLQHKACKPELVFDKEKNELTPIFLKENEGRGNIVITHIPSKKE